MMNPICVLLYGLLLLGCTSKDLPNEYVFSEPTADCYVIVNGCKDGGNFIEGNKRRFVFPENGILLANMESFDITAHDIFLIGQKSFDPNPEDPSSYSLCYHMVSKNSGYAQEKFDFYFFKVGQSCSEGTNGLDDFFDDLLDYLKNHNIKHVP